MMRAFAPNSTSSQPSALFFHDTTQLGWSTQDHCGDGRPYKRQRMELAGGDAVTSIHPPNDVQGHWQFQSIYGYPPTGTAQTFHEHYHYPSYGGHAVFQGGHQSALQPTTGVPHFYQCAAGQVNTAGSHNVPPQCSGQSYLPSTTSCSHIDPQYHTPSKIHNSRDHDSLHDNHPSEGFWEHGPLQNGEETNGGDAYHDPMTFMQDVTQHNECEKEYEQPSSGVKLAAALECYGYLRDLAVVELESAVADNVDVTWDGSSEVSFGPTQRLRLPDRIRDILSTLSSTADVVFEFRVAGCNDQNSASGSCKRGNTATTTTTSISAIVYGPREANEDVGSWLDDIGLCLQTPHDCSRDVPYRNPHKMSDFSRLTIMTSQLRDEESATIHKSSAPFQTSASDMYTSRVFAEAPQPKRLKSRLHSHQLQGLTFMQGREQGWDLLNERGTNDLWQRTVDAFGREKYIDTLSGQTFHKPPPTFLGGILADDMGLGKTCSMLAVIAADEQKQMNLCPTKSKDHRSRYGTTLIVVPLPLLQVWEKQIREHFHPDAIHFSTYHGQAKVQQDTFNDLDIVLTTYNTVSREWKAGKVSRSSDDSSRLLSHHWHRIILDEAHMIKNRDTDVSKAAAALYGDRRWCMTGTPIQNRSSDLFGLLRFLKVHPYDNHKTFEKSFIQPWKVQADSAALQKLQRLFQAIAIRRPRGTITLPPRDEFTRTVMFYDEERDLYERTKQRVVEYIDAACDTSSSYSGRSYINALQRINDLRFICNHGMLLKQAKPVQSRFADAPFPNGIVSAVDNLLSAQDFLICASCGADLLDESQGNKNLLQVNASQPRYGPSRTCGFCSTMSSTCADSNHLLPTSSPGESIASSPGDQAILSSKVAALVQEIHHLPPGDKCVIFSYWTTSLNIISRALSEAGIAHINYEGSMSRRKRDAVLHEFNTSLNLKATLVSITCGGQGLDLTVANHAFLFEPQWNPMLEEQAMARVHRMGQSKPVRLVRFVVKNSWEEKIVTLQERKRLLADLIVDSKGMLEGDNARRQLVWLKDLVS